MDVRKVQDVRKNVEHQYITEDSKTRIYLSVVREFNEKEYEEYSQKKEKSENKKENSLFEKVDGLHRSYSSQPYLLRISERYALRNKGKRRTRIRMDSNPAHVGVGIRIDQIRCRRCILKAPDA